MRFIVQGELPGLNQIIDACKRRKGKWSAYSEMKKIQMERVSWAILAAHIVPPAVYRPVRIRFRWINGSLKRDLDNIVAAKKFILDAMVKTGILKNDTQEHVKGWTEDFGLDRANPRIEVEVEEV